MKPNYPKLIFSLLASWYFLKYATDVSVWHFIDNVNLLIHEAGHVIFYFFGDLIRVAGGSILQVLIPLVFFFYFVKAKEYYSSSVILFWVGQNILNVSHYASDAIKMDLPLLGGDGVIHDWNYILDSLGILQYTDMVGKSIYYLGVLVILFAIVYSLKFSVENPE